MNRRITVISVALFVVGSFSSVASGQGRQADYERADNLNRLAAGKALNLQLQPTWYGPGKFWYKPERPGRGSEWVVVDAETGSKTLHRVGPLPVNVPRPEPRRGPRRTGGNADRPTTFVRDANLWLRDTGNRRERPLTKDGKPDDFYTGRVFWSPDGSRMVALRQSPGGDRKVTLIESAPKDQLQPKVSTYSYLKPGDKIPQTFPVLFDMKAEQEIPIERALFDNPWSIRNEHWSADGQEFRFVYNQRGHQVMRVIGINAETGKVRTIVNEDCPTFFDYANKFFFDPLAREKELIWMSERSGWNHLYLIDAESGDVVNPITQGDWLVRSVELVDPVKRQVWFKACGIHPDQDPYHVHYARVNFDGSGLTLLTEGDGNHTLQFGPGREYYIDSYSRVDLPPVHELRRSRDGKLVMSLVTADVSGLKRAGWQPPERFVAKGRDGKTDIHGVIFRPWNFRPGQKYKVIEHIYAGPHGQFVPKEFRPVHYEQKFAELGFILVKVDGMGTNWRHKEFHNVCWKNLGDSGFPDRIAWIKAAAAAHPELDIAEGVGIFGGSAGGQSTLRGLTAHPDFYTVGVADCGCHDNRMDKVWWNELWMSWPVGPHYAEQSNVTNAGKLQGKLMLIVGELDRNVDPSSTMQVVDALVKADKDFELLVMPGVGHGAAESRYGHRRRVDFLVRHLLGVEPRRN